MNIFQRFNIKPAMGSSMLCVPGEFRASTALDISELDPEARTQLITELEAQGLSLNVRGNTLEVEGPVTFEYSRGVDQEGRKALWLNAEGAIVDLLAQTLAYIYASKGWPLSTGRILREVIARIGGEIKLPDGHTIFLGSSNEYKSSVLCSDGSYVHPKLSLSIADSDDVIDEDDPFK